MAHIINAGLQVVPLCEPRESFPIIDRCIERIRAAGLKYEVAAMETVVEGSFAEVQQLVEDIHDFLIREFRGACLLNVRFHIDTQADVYMKDKIAQFR